MIQIEKTFNDQQTELKTKIYQARKHLDFLWEIKGCSDSEVLKASIELDHLLNEYAHLVLKQHPQN